MDSEDDEMNASFDEDNPDARSDISCLAESVVSENSSLGSSLSFSSVGSEATISTPKRNKGKAQTKRGKQQQQVAGAGNTAFKVPSSAPIKIIGRCPHCNAGLKTMNGLQNHIRGHEWKERASRKPSSTDVKVYCAEASDTVLKVLKNNPAGGQFGPDYNNYVEEIIRNKNSKEWMKFVSKSSEIVAGILCPDGVNKGQGSRNNSGKTFASGMRYSLYESISKLLADKEQRDNLLELLLQAQLVITNVAFPFLFDFLLKLGESAMVFIFKCIGGRLNAGANQRRSRSKDDFMSPKGRQIIHFIAGSCMKSQLRHAYRYPKNNRLKQWKFVILAKFAGSPPTVLDKKDKAYWTKTLNRKSLFFVNDIAFEFFLELAMLLQKMELTDGTIGHIAVMEKVIETPSLLLKWDSIVECSLSEENSFQFMVKVIRTLSNTYGLGVMLRRMNTMWKRGKGNKGSIAISHRAHILKPN